MFLRLTALLFLWQAVAFESHNFTGCHVDIVRIKEQDSVTLSAHSLVSCAIVGQRLYQWTDRGVACYSHSSGACVSFNGPYFTYEVPGATSGWSCAAHHPTTQSKDHYLALKDADALGITLAKKEDGMYYFTHSDRKVFDDGRQFCQQVHGFDFPVVITQQQFDVAEQYDRDIGSFYLGLNNTGDKYNPTWLNGLPFSVTEENTGERMHITLINPVAYHMYWYDFHDYPPTNRQAVLCQANLDHLDWNVPY